MDKRSGSGIFPDPGDPKIPDPGDPKIPDPGDPKIPGPGPQHWTFDYILDFCNFV